MSFNTKGKLVYPIPGGGTSCVTPNGKIEGTTVPPEEKSWWDRWGDTIHTALDVAGMVPVIGEFADGANAVIYLAEGDLANAAISGAALLPIGGQAATGARLGVKAVSAGADVVKAADKAKDAVKAADAAKDAAKAADAAKDAAKASDAAKDAKKASDGADGTKVKGDGGGDGGGKKKEHDRWCRKRNLYPGSAACNVRESTIKNIEHDIRKRTGEFHEDKFSLPWDKPGAALEETRNGHVRIINELKAVLAGHKAVWVACCGGAW